MIGPHETTRIAADIAAALDHPGAVTSWAAPNWTTAPPVSSVDIDAMLALAARFDRPREPRPVAVRASEGAIARMRAMSTAPAPEPSVGDPPGFDVRLLAGLPVYLDRDMTPGAWRFAYSRDDVPRED
jgi:hypothetical protein